MIIRQNHPTILLLCSSPIMRSVLTEVLEDKGYNVLPCGGLGTAVERLKKHDPDLLIVRPYVDNMEGHDAALYLRERRQGMKILIVGGLIDDDRLRHRESLHNVEIFPKPFTREELLEAVRAVLEKPAQDKIAPVQPLHPTPSVEPPASGQVH